MLDVHAPRGAAHTWKDFWIHLGTISIGLLIAIGLEQSVEAGHRLHERHRLEEDLQLEARKNLRGYWWSDSPYWDTAKESAEVGLLPREEASMYNLVYAQQGVMKDRLEGYGDVMDKMRRFESRFAKIEAAALSVLLNDALTELARFHSLTDLAYGITRAVTLGAKSDEQLLQIMGARAEDKLSQQNLTVH